MKLNFCPSPGFFDLEETLRPMFNGYSAIVNCNKPDLNPYSDLWCPNRANKYYDVFERALSKSSEGFEEVKKEFLSGTVAIRKRATEDHLNLTVLKRLFDQCNTPTHLLSRVNRFLERTHAIPILLLGGMAYGMVMLDRDQKRKLEEQKQKCSEKKSPLKKT